MQQNNTTHNSLALKLTKLQQIENEILKNWVLKEKEEQRWQSEKVKRGKIFVNVSYVPNRVFKTPWTNHGGQNIMDVRTFF